MLFNELEIIVNDIILINIMFFYIEFILNRLKDFFRYLIYCEDL